MSYTKSHSWDQHNFKPYHLLDEDIPNNAALSPSIFSPQYPRSSSTLNMNSQGMVVQPFQPTSYNLVTMHPSVFNIKAQAPISPPPAPIALVYEDSPQYLEKFQRDYPMQDYPVQTYREKYQDDYQADSPAPASPYHKHFPRYDSDPSLDTSQSNLRSSQPNLRSSAYFSDETGAPLRYYVLPKKRGYDQEFPIILSGIISKEEYVQTVRTINHVIAIVNKKKKYGKRVMAPLMISGSLIILPLFPAIILENKRLKEITEGTVRALQPINEVFIPKGLKWTMAEIRGNKYAKRLCLEICARNLIDPQNLTKFINYASTQNEMYFYPD